MYCIIWSVALFVVTFYGLLSQEKAFDFTGKDLLPVAQTHIMPMIMAMTLYLWDVLYNVSMRRLNDEKSTFWILLMIILFLGFFVFSILVNDNTIGWILFIGSWLSLTMLKFKTTESEQVQPYQILED